MASKKERPVSDLMILLSSILWFFLLSFCLRILEMGYFLWRVPNIEYNRPNTKWNNYMGKIESSNQTMLFINYWFILYFYGTESLFGKQKVRSKNKQETKLSSNRIEQK